MVYLCTSVHTPSHSKSSLYVLQCTLLTCSKDMLLRSMWEGNGIQFRNTNGYWLCTCHLTSLFDLATLKKICQNPQVIRGRSLEHNSREFNTSLVNIILSIQQGSSSTFNICNLYFLSYHKIFSFPFQLKVVQYCQ